MSYLCDLFSNFIFSFIMINRVIWWIQTLEYVLLFSYEEWVEFSDSKSSASRSCLAFAWFFCQFQHGVAYKSIALKKPVISSYLECLYKTFGQVPRNLSISYVCIMYWLYPKLILKQRNLSLSLRQNTEITELSSESQVLKLSQKWIYVKRNLTEEVFMKSIYFYKKFCIA